MIRSALFAFALVCAACASDPNPSDTLGPPADAAGGGVDVAGRGALAGAGGSPAIGMAGSAAGSAAGTGVLEVAGASADAGASSVAGSGGSPSDSAAGGGGVGGSAGAVEVAGTGAAGSSVAGSSGQAGAAGAAEPVVHELWTITQSNAMQGGTNVNTVNAPQDLTVRLEPSGPGSVPATTLLWTFGRNDTVEHTFTMVSGAASLDAAYIACGAFRSYWQTTGANVSSGVTTETPAHVTYVHLVASSKLTGSTEAWQLEVSVSWTAYGY